MKLTSGNSKLHRSVGIWDLPAGHTTCGIECKGCYALRSQKRFPAVMDKRERNFEFAKSKDFSIDIGKHKYVRVHSSGDFFAQSYIDKWIEIAKSNLSTVFYAYTKRLKDFDFTKLKSLPNFVLHNSLLPDGSYNYDKDLGKLQAKCQQSYVCPATTNIAKGCGYDCWWCMDKTNQGIQILFKEH